MTIPFAKVHATVSPEDIYYVSWNLDGCDGLGFLQTDSAQKGDVTIFAPANLLDEIYSFFEGLKAEGVDANICSVEEN